MKNEECRYTSCTWNSERWLWQAGQIANLSTWLRFANRNFLTVFEVAAQIMTINSTISFRFLFGERQEFKAQFLRRKCSTCQDNRSMDRETSQTESCRSSNITASEIFFFFFFCPVFWSKRFSNQHHELVCILRLILAWTKRVDYIRVCGKSLLRKDPDTIFLYQRYYFFLFSLLQYLSLLLWVKFGFCSVHKENHSFKCFFESRCTKVGWTT